MNPIRKLYKDMVNPHIRKIREKFIRHEILQYSKILSRQDISVELYEVIDFLKNNSYVMLPYEFTSKYKERKVPVYYNSSLKMAYIVENEKNIL